MADTRAPHAAPAHGPSIPVEGDGINYRGLVWFGVILAITTLFCMALVWGMFLWWERREAGREAARAPVAAPATVPTIIDGRIDGGSRAPQPALLVTEPAVLQRFRDQEQATLDGYGWVDRNAGTVRIPIRRAKDLLLERGLPIRGAAPAAPATAGAKTTGAKTTGK
jgi:hypothetical protein